MEIMIRRGDRQYGPYGVEQVSQMLENGSVVPEDEASVDGGVWIRVDEIPGISRVPVPVAVDAVPDTMHVTAADLIPEPAPIALWDPNHAASAAVLSLGVIGPVIHALNWRALGDDEKERAAWGWSAAFLAAYAVLFLLRGHLAVEDRGFYPVGVVIGLLVGWWFGAGRAQVRFIRDLSRGRAVYRSSKSLILGSLALLMGVLAIYLPAAEPKEPNLASGRDAVEERNNGELSIRARRATETLVRMNLKAPTTARFSGFTVIDSSGPYFQVLVTVDSQNSFGAMIRGDVVTAFKLEDDGKFSYNQFSPVIFIDPDSLLQRGEFNFLQEEMIRNQKKSLKWPGVKESGNVD